MAEVYSLAAEARAASRRRYEAARRERMRYDTAYAARRRAQLKRAEERRRMGAEKRRHPTAQNGRAHGAAGVTDGRAADGRMDGRTDGPSVQPEILHRAPPTDAEIDEALGLNADGGDVMEKLLERLKKKNEGEENL